MIENNVFWKNIGFMYQNNEQMAIFGAENNHCIHTIDHTITTMTEKCKLNNETYCKRKIQQDTKIVKPSTKRTTLRSSCLLI